MSKEQPKPPFEVHTFNVSGDFIEKQAFNINDLEVAETIARSYSSEHSGFAQVIDADGNVVIYSMYQPRDVTPLDPGLLQPDEVSKVPFTMFMQIPSPDLPQDGVETVYYKSSKKELISVLSDVQRYLGIDTARMVEHFFSGGFYRLEILVGDCSLKIYKHPSVK